MGSIVDASEVLLELGLTSSPTDVERAVVNEAIRKAEGAVKRHLRYDPKQSSRTQFYPTMGVGAAISPSVWEVNDTQAYERSLNQASTTELQVRGLPIRSNPAIVLYIDYDGRSGARSGAFAASTQKTEGVDFWPNYELVDSNGYKVCLDGILKSQGLWPVETGSVKIVYTAGYSAAELHGQDTVIDASPIMDAVVDEAVRRATKAFTRAKKSLVGFAAGPITSESLGDYSYSVDGASLAKLVGASMDIMPETAEKLAEYVNLGWGMGV